MFEILTTMFLLTSLFANIDNLPNKTSELISTYAKVAHWGSTHSKTTNEARSKGQISWTRSSEPAIRERPKKKPTYYYPRKSPTSKVDRTNQNSVLSKGEVQERFNPRPYFDFTFNDYPYKKPDKPESPTIVYGSPVNSKPSTDSYSSPFNSYNPPKFKPDETLPIVDFPPNTNDSFSSPIRPPLNFPDNFNPSITPPQIQVNDMESNDDQPSENKPNEPPPTQDTEETYLDRPPSDSDYNYHHHHHRPSKPTLVEEHDLVPPPYGKFPPKYLDNDPEDYHHYHHHPVYHEVKPSTTSTTTIKPRAGHYSYYYLGRKLWYIPLYFSVYFIVYVTVLILKSIARHKIQFSHNFDKGRSLTDSYADPKVIDAVENVNNKYM